MNPRFDVVIVLVFLLDLTGALQLSKTASNAGLLVFW